MERGEVEGICESLDSVKIRRPDWIATGSIKVLFQGAVEPNPELKDVPFVLDLARTPEHKQAIEFSMPARASGGRSWRHRSCRRNAADAARRIQRDHEGRGFIADVRKSKLELEPETASSSRR